MKNTKCKKIILLINLFGVFGLVKENNGGLERQLIGGFAIAGGVYIGASFLDDCKKGGCNTLTLVLAAGTFICGFLVLFEG